MKRNDLAYTAKRLTGRDHFLANHLRCLEELRGETRDELAEHLSLDGESFDRLALCKPPRLDGHFASDTTAIAGYVSAALKPFANSLRLLQALASLRRATSHERDRRQHEENRLLAVARSITDEPVSERQIAPDKAMRAAWLEDATRLILGDDQGWQLGAHFPRDLELSIVLHLPLAIVELPALSGNLVVDWLARYDVQLDVYTPPHELRGALVANGGSGVLFVCADDPDDERRLTIAHEAAHFAIDYWAPRQRIAQQAPQLLEVLDGERPATEGDFIDGFLSHAPVGFQTHLFERNEAGKALDLALGEVEERATLAAWELLAPQKDIWAKADSANKFSMTRMLEDDFGLPRVAAREYSDFLQRISTSPERDRFSFDDD